MSWCLLSLGKVLHICKTLINVRDNVNMESRYWVVLRKSGILIPLNLASLSLCKELCSPIAPISCIGWAFPLANVF